MPLVQRHDQLRRIEIATTPINTETQNQPDLIGEIISFGDARGRRNTHVVEEAVEVWDDADDVCDIGSPVPAVEIVVNAVLVAGVKVVDLEIAAGNDVVVA